MAGKTSYIFIKDLKKFDASKIKVHVPKTIKFNKGQISYTQSEMRYIDNNGKECIPYVLFPTQRTFGVAPIFPLNMTDKQKEDPKNIKGYQVDYPIVAFENMEEPTEEEVQARRILDAFHNATVEAASNPANLKKIPAAARQFLKNDPKEGVKPIYAFPKKQDPEDPENPDAKVDDPTKPERLYAKLLMQGKVIRTRFYGPGDVKVSPLKYLKVRGDIAPAFKFEGIYWGTHGNNSPYGASVQIRLFEATFTPSGSDDPEERIVGKNNAAEDDEEEFVPKKKGDEKESDGFDEETVEDEFDKLASRVSKAKPAAAKKVAKPAPVEEEEEEEVKVSKPKPVAKKVAKPKPAPVEDEEEEEVKVSKPKPKPAAKAAPSKVKKPAKPAEDDE